MQRGWRRSVVWCRLLVCACVVWVQGRAAAQSSELQNFFENRIRPILVEHCYECHSAETETAGGLSLDSRHGLREGGDTGPAIVAGDSGSSLLIRAISYADPQLQMPPAGKLSEQVVQDFRRWIDQGAEDPRLEIPKAEGSNEEAESESHRSSSSDGNHSAASHWAYQPLNRFTIPTAMENDPSMGPIDSWINSRLTLLGLGPTEPAKPAVLARRLYFDLIGLPPTAAQLSEAVQEIQAGRHEVMVDRLLASPHFGEHQARRWMDVARYADSITLRGFILPQAWRYRDYLIESFNQDRSFATMIREQLAGDLMQASEVRERQRQVIGTAFLALGNTNLEKQDKLQLEMDYLDEQLDVIGTAFLGQTLGCARCHDHKFDPIPTRDYYALAGILRSSSGMKHANVSEWIELPLPLDPSQTAHFDQLEREEKSLKQELQRLKESLDKDSGTPDRIPVKSLPGIVIDNAQAKLVGRWVSSTFARPLVGDDYLHDADEQQGEKSATFEPGDLPPGRYEVRLAYQSGSNRSSRVLVKVFSADGEQEILIDQRKAAPELGLWLSLGQFRFEKNGQAYILISNADSDGHVIADAVQFLPVGDEQASETQVAGGSTAVPTRSEEHRKSIEKTKMELEGRIASLSATLKQRPRYLTIVESGQPVDLAIHIRGNVHSLGELVPRGFLTAIAQPNTAQPPNALLNSTPISTGNSSGSVAGEAISGSSGPNRLDLANWIASDSNPLTARVYANRVWLWLMGSGLVGTPNNFGTTGEPPSQPELLDWLALRLIESDWSTKTLVREIVLSQAYQRSTNFQPNAAASRDPDNRAYWQGPSHRLTVESLRDAMLVVSHELDTSLGGSLIRPGAANDFDYLHASTRRSIYNPVFRNSLPELYEPFDFADPSTSIGKRERSTHAMQGLSLANNPWVLERSRQAAKHWVRRAQTWGVESSVAELLTVCFARQATAEELQLSIDFVQSHGGTEGQVLHRWELLIQSLFASLDFRFLE